jgi:ribonuclease HI
MYTIYIDGACSGNPGPGAVGLVVCTAEGRELRRYSKAFPQATNNQMELRAAIAALMAVPTSSVTIVSDSAYVVSGATQWLPRWKANHWHTTTKAPVANQELWQALSQLLTARRAPVTWIRKSDTEEPKIELAHNLAQETLWAWKAHQS